MTNFRATNGTMDSASTLKTQKGVYIPKNKEDIRKLIYTYAQQLKDQTKEIEYLRGQNQELSDKFCNQKALNDAQHQKMGFYSQELSTIPTLKIKIEQLTSTIKQLNEQVTDFKIRNDDQELRIVGLVKTEKRLLELIKSTQKYNDVALMPFSKTAKSKKSKKNAFKMEKQIKELNDVNLVYLEGSKALSQLDTYVPKFSQQFKKKMPVHFRQWYAKAREGLLEEEKDLWTTHESIQIVRNFMSGAYSKREDLAIEKLIYELGKQQRRILGSQNKRRVKSLNIKIRRLKMSLKESQTTIDSLVSYIEAREHLGFFPVTESSVADIDDMGSSLKNDQQFDIYPADDAESKDYTPEDYIRHGSSSQSHSKRDLRMEDVLLQGQTEEESSQRGDVINEVNEDAEFD